MKLQLAVMFLVLTTKARRQPGFHFEWCAARRSCAGTEISWTAPRRSLCRECQNAPPNPWRSHPGDNMRQIFPKSHACMKPGTNPSAHRHVEITTIASKVSTNQGAKNLNRDGGNAGVFSRRCAVMGQTGREAESQGRGLVQEERFRGGAPFAQSRTAGRCHHARWIRRGRAGNSADARMAQGKACWNLQKMRAVRSGRGIGHAAAPSGIHSCQGRPVSASNFRAIRAVTGRRPVHKSETCPFEQPSFSAKSSILRPVSVRYDATSMTGTVRIVRTIAQEKSSQCA